jgi:hypothetical protein
VPQIGGQRELESRGLAEGAADDRLEIAHDGVEPDHLWPQHLAPAEREQLLGDRGGALGGAPYLLQIRPRRGILHPPLDERRGAEDDGHLVVRLVGDAASQASHRLHPLRLPEAFLVHPAVLDIGHGADPLPRHTVQPQHRGGPGDDVAVRSMGPGEDAALHLVDRQALPRAAPGVQQGFPVVGVQRLHPAGATILLLRLPGIPLPGGLRLGEPPVAVGGPHDGCRRGDQGPVPLLAPGQLLLRALAVGNVPRDGRGTDHHAGAVPDGRDRERDVDPASVLADAHRLGELGPLPPADALKQGPLGGVQLLGDHRKDRPAHDLLRGVSEDPLGGRVPAGDDALQRLADDSVAGGGDDRGQALRGLVAHVAGGDIPHRPHDA